VITIAAGGPDAGTYSFVSHYMIDAERGAHGLFDVTK